MEELHAKQKFALKRLHEVSPWLSVYSLPLQFTQSEKSPCHTQKLEDNAHATNIARRETTTSFFEKRSTSLHNEGVSQ